MLQRIELPVSLTGADFRVMSDTMLGEDATIKDIADAFSISVPSVRAAKAGGIGKNGTRKIVGRWNAFVDNGGKLDPQVDEPPFVAVDLVRDRVSGVMRRIEDVHPALIGARSGKIETEDEVVGRISQRFGIMESMMRRILRGNVRSMIIQAAPGVGKSHRLNAILSAHNDANDGFEFVNLSGGGVTPLSLLKACYRARKNGVVVLDDNDSCLEQEESINLLKTALDSSEKRVLNWTKMNRDVYDAYGEDPEDGRIPSNFEFNGAFVFITNSDFQALASGSSNKAPHIKALIDRSFFVNLTIQTLRDKVLWCDYVFRAFMAEDLSPETVEEISAFVKKNMHRFFSVSCRLFKDAISLASDPDDAMDWRTIIEVTKFSS